MTTVVSVRRTMFADAEFTVTGYRTDVDAKENT
jgi:hypothetical protein